MLTYDLGNSDRPVGHALLYFRVQNDPSQVVASYIVVPPITMDFAKYVPPMFAGQFDQFVAQGPTAFPLPPIPEPVESLDWLQSVAAARHDDLLNGGSLDPKDVGRAMQTVGDIAGEYTLAYTRAIDDQVRSAGVSEPEALVSMLDADDILLDVMTDSEKVNRLAKLTGTLRYAVDGRDHLLQDETVRSMQSVGRRLAEHYQVAELIRAAQLSSPEGQQLANVYLERCYCLARQDIEALQAIDGQIRSLRAEAGL